MNKVTFEQMKAMRFGMLTQGSYTHIKLRFLREVVENICTNPIMRRHLHALSVFHFNSGKSILAGIVHQQDFLFFQDFEKAKLQAQGAKLISKGKKVIQSTQGTLF